MLLRTTSARISHGTAEQVPEVHSGSGTVRPSRYEGLPPKNEKKKEARQHDTARQKNAVQQREALIGRQVSPAPGPQIQILNARQPQQQKRSVSILLHGDQRRITYPQNPELKPQVTATKSQGSRGWPGHICGPRPSRFKGVGRKGCIQCPS